MTNSTAERCAWARSCLFTPGNRPERFQKATRSGADAVVLDVEDSVPAPDKASARDRIGSAWDTLLREGVPLVVRVNALDTDEFQRDLAWLVHLPSPAAVMLPKAGSAPALASVRDALGGIPLLPIVESASGYLALPSLAAVPGVLRLVIGHIDFMADTGLQCDELETELAPLRFAVSMATRAHQLTPAVDGVTVEIANEARLRRDVQRALRFGFGGKLCIHPRQVAVVHAELAPSARELEWAHRVIAADAAAHGSAVQLDGRMVDRPVVLQAHRTLARGAGVGDSKR